MPSDYIFKVLVLGFPEIGKTTFLDELSDSGQFNGRNSIGISFQVINSIIENRFKIKLQLWDFKTSTRFLDYYPVFCRGSSACILCFDASDGASFKYLQHWINLVRFSEQDQAIPIFLIGLKSDNDRGVSNMQIHGLTMKNDLDGLFFYSTNSTHKKKIIFNYITNYLVKNTVIHSHRNIRNKEFKTLSHRPRSHIYLELEELREIIANLQGYDTQYRGFLSRKDKEQYYKFLDYFSACPICFKLLHISYLTKFYFDATPENIKFKQRLIRLMEESRKVNRDYNRIQIGIPCCECYKKVFDS